MKKIKQIHCFPASGEDFWYTAGFGGVAEIKCNLADNGEGVYLRQWLINYEDGRSLEIINVPAVVEYYVDK